MLLLISNLKWALGITVFLALAGLLLAIFQLKAKNIGVALCSALIALGNIISGAIQYSENLKTTEETKIFQQESLGSTKIPAIGCKFYGNHLTFYLINTDSFTLRDLKIDFSWNTNSFSGNIRPRASIEILKIDSTSHLQFTWLSILFNNNRKFSIFILLHKNPDGSFIVDSKYFDDNHSDNYRHPFEPDWKKDTNLHKYYDEQDKNSAPMLYKSDTFYSKKY
jgi:hypothetical protein